MKKHLRFLPHFLFLVLISVVGYAVTGAYILPPPAGQNQTAQSIAGMSDTGNQFVLLKANEFNALRVTTSPSGQQINVDSVNIPNAGATDRTQMPDREGFYHCTIQADSDNTGSVYVGGPGVTNESGSFQGIELQPYDALSNIAVPGNLNFIWVATETAGNDVTYFCN